MRQYLHMLEPGKKVSFYGNPCIILERYPNGEGTLLLSCEPVKYRFGESNNFNNSFLMKYLNENCLDKLTQNRPDIVFNREIDLTALNGSKEYGKVRCKIAPLSLNELQKYQDIIPEPKAFEWSVTPWGTTSKGADCTSVFGLTVNNEVIRTHCAYFHMTRPAFLVPSFLSVDIEDESEKCNGLESYSTNELLAEITRRMAAQNE